MAKSLTLGNGSLFLTLDHLGQVRDLYFPYVGLENHVGGQFVHRIGVFVDGEISFLDDGEWQVEVRLEPNMLASQIKAWHNRHRLSLNFTDLIYNEKSIFLRKVVVKNLAKRTRAIKVFFCQQFEIAESHTAHTAYYDPASKSLIHYRNQRAFLISAQIEGKSFDDYTTGVFGMEGKEGSHVDAKDGVLAQNPIEHGQADSVLALTDHYSGEESRVIYYWLTAGQGIPQALELHNYLLSKGPAHLIETTKFYWRAWIQRRNFSFHGLTPEVVALFNSSLLFLRAHVGDNGAIIASADSNALQKGKDTYAYVWPRDASYTALALTQAGDSNVAKLFYDFCRRAINPDGYLMHKYSPDGSLGSSWHPWLRRGKVELPIQEDETALMLWSLWRYYSTTKDLEFIEQSYRQLIQQPADFMVLYRDERTGLPKPSYDLWEEKFGTSTFTASAVYGALRSAAAFANLLGKVKSRVIYERAAEEIKEGILRYLYDERSQRFLKMIEVREDEVWLDTTIDSSSVYGLYTFDVLPLDDRRLVKAVADTLQALRVPSPVGGVARYAGDRYYSRSENGSGNPWFITTLWFAQYEIKKANSEADLTGVKETLRWVTTHADHTGTLSEQLDPETGLALSVSPLTWSHAEYVRTVIAYLDKLEELGVCQACNPVY